MAQRQPIFTRDEVELFGFELRTKFRDGVRSPDALVYVLLTLIGVGWATYAIPAINSSHISPETLGVYVIGFLVTLCLDATFTWKKKNGENKYEQAIAALCMCAALVLIIFVSYFSVVSSPSEPPSKDAIWKTGAYVVIWLCFIASVLMALVISGFDAGTPPVGPLDISLDAVEDRNGQP